SLSDDKRALFSKDTYLVRNMVNQFTQPNGTRPVPYGEILNHTRGTTNSHSGRVQLNFNRAWNNRHRLTAIAGAEVRQVHAVSDRYRLYGYDSETLTMQPVDMVSFFTMNPSRVGRIPDFASAGDLIDRYVSEYANASYSYDSRYVVTASGRRDASNLFGVKTNQKSVPLWSVGGGWTISNERFFRADWLPYLKLRMSYGYNGNINKSATAFSTASYYTDGLTGQPAARILTPPDPQLRWEKVAIYNAGIDFELKNRRLGGSLEFYKKKGTDQIGTIPLDPTTGFFLADRYSTTRNGAAIRGSGFDAELTSRNTTGALKWQTTFLFSYTKDEVISYQFEHPIISYLISGSPIEGRPVNSLYAYRWAGLDPQTGDPMAYIEGTARKDYASMFSAQTIEDVAWMGTILPPFFGALRNAFSWKALSASVNINYKFGHVFRRNSIGYSSLYTAWKGHEDFRLRWQKPGDEKVTNVPSMPQGLISNRDHFYLFSEALVEKADHIRLQDLSLRYTPNLPENRFPFKDLSLMLSMENVGILWRANKAGIDPDYSLASMLPVRTISLGFKTTL
ncbi:MAG TPA: SusC/RagA family TonB-linked outer membrane protein, partial [Sphingobacteriaceae bacterium]